MNRPPAPNNKHYPLIFVDYQWQQQIPNIQEIPVPPTPKKGFQEILVEGKWCFIKK